MLRATYIKIFLILFILFLMSEHAFPCSAYKFTVNGKTMIGDNEDSWQLHPRIWFEKGGNGKYGVAYLGYDNSPHSEGAMNEHGLVWAGFSVPTRDVKDQSQRGATFLLTDIAGIMQKCKTVDEVNAILKNRNLNYLNGDLLFNGGMLLFIDKSGKYLVVEADTLIMGNESVYLLSNFCPSKTKDLSKIQLARYRNGVELVKNLPQNDLNSCVRLSDTMHVCRGKVGDGTLYTTIYDPDESSIYLYFYHDYSHPVKFDLKKELAMNDHSLEMAALFPPNKEFQAFKNYLTPQSSRFISVLLLSAVLILAFSCIYFLISYFKARKTLSATGESFQKVKLSVVFINVILIFYIFILKQNQFLFYFTEPFKGMDLSALKLAQYVPVLMLLIIVPLVIALRNILKGSSWKKFPKALFAINNVIIAILLGLCIYWKLII